MIENFPSSGDFYRAGTNLLNYSWGTTIQFFKNLDDAENHFAMHLDTKEQQQYWQFARRELEIAFVSLQQGVELIIKGKIAAVSPYLLFSEPPKKPLSSAPINVDFSEFRTVDAQDLIGILNTVTDTPLPLVFFDKFQHLRKTRNKLMHTVDQNIDVNADEILEQTLYVFTTLLPDKSWFQERIEFLDSTADTLFGGDSWSTNAVCWELDLIYGRFKKALLKKYFGYEKGQHRYFCPICVSTANRDGGFDYKLAFLIPKGPKTKSLFCPICNKNHSVERIECKAEKCKGNVFDQEGECLTCMSW